MAEVKTVLTYGEDSSHFEIMERITVASCFDIDDGGEI